MPTPMSSGENRDRMLRSRPPRTDRLFSPQYRRMAQAMSSRTRLIFFLFSSNGIPPF